MPATSIHPEFTARRVQEMSILKYNFLHFQKRNITVCPTMWSFAFLIWKCYLPRWLTKTYFKIFCILLKTNFITVEFSLDLTFLSLSFVHCWPSSTKILEPLLGKQQLNQNNLKLALNNNITQCLFYISEFRVRFSKYVEAFIRRCASMCGWGGCCYYPSLVVKCRWKSVS